MKKICTGIFILLFISLSGMGQSREEAEIKAAVETLDKALIDTNKTVLESLVADEVSYGHSNGKVENKQEFISAQSGFKKLTRQILPFNSTGRLLWFDIFSRHPCWTEESPGPLI